MPPEILVTGVGIISPAGINAPATWCALLAGRRCVRRISDPARTRGLAVCAAPAPDEPLSVVTGVRHDSRACRMAVVAAGEAAGGGMGHQYKCHCHSRPTYTVIGSSKFYSGVGIENTLFTVVPACAICSSLNLDGPVQTAVTACASGTHAVIRAAQLIADGHADRVVCGGADASLDPLWLAAYAQMGVLAPEHPGRGAAFACRPFDRTRNGFAPGEGAAVLILESAASARHAGGVPVARIAGWASGTDPTGLTQLDPTGEPLSHVIRKALDMARCNPRRLGAVIAHGTGTSDNDAVETRALRTALNSAVHGVPIVSVKGAIGHLLGAAGAVEIAVAVLACRDGRCPGNATLIEPDPEFADLTLPTESFALRQPTILKTSLGFGGHLAAVVVTAAARLLE